MKNISHIGHEMANRTISSVLKDTGSTPTNLVKVGTGTLTLSANNLYTGNTIINNGILNLGNTTQITMPSLSGMLLWIDASTISNISDLQNIDVWRDLSPNNNNNLTRTSGNIIYKKNAFNGNPAVRFQTDGNSYFTFNRLTNIRTVFWVFKQNTTGSSKNFPLGDSSTYNFHRDENATDYIWEDAYASSSILNGVTRKNGVQVNGASTPLGTNWVSLNVVTTGNVIATYLSNDRSISGRSWNGDIAEIIIYNRALSSDEVLSVEQYLNNKWFNTNILPSSTNVILSSSGLLNLNNTNQRVNTISGNGIIYGNTETTLTIDSSSNCIYDGIISGSCSLAKFGTKELTLYGNNTFSGSTIIGEGTLTVNSLNNKGQNGPIGSNSLLKIWGGTLKYGDGTITFDKDIELFGKSTINVTGSNQNLILIGNISGNGDFCKSGLGFINLSGGIKNYVGNTIVSGGTLILGTQQSIPTTSAVLMSNVANTILDCNYFNTTVGSVDGGNTAGGNILIYNKTLTIGTDNTNNIFGGKISGSGGYVIKTGYGTQRFLSQAQLYNGVTIVSGGVLELNYNSGGTGTLSTTSVLVLSGAMLRSNVTNAFGWSGNAWIKNLNLNYGIWDITSTGDSCWGLTINMSGGIISTVNATYLSLGNGNSIINTYPASRASLISGAGIITSRQTDLTYTVLRGNTPEDLIINLGGGIQMPIRKLGNGIMNVKSTVSTLVSVLDGKLILSGTNTSTNPVNILSGECAVNGTCVSASVFNVSGGKLSGNGIINGSVILTNNNSSIIQAGSGVDNTPTLTVGQLTFNGTSSVLQINTNGISGISNISVLKSCSLSGCLVDISGALNTGTYTAIAATIAMSGITPTLRANGTGKTISLSVSGDKNLNIIAT